MNEATEILSRKIAARLRKCGVDLTLGGEPSFVPVNPEGAEWKITATGPTKLRYAWKFSETISRRIGGGPAVFYSPGKSYPGETNPRWALNMIWNRNGARLCPAPARAPAVSAKSLALFRRYLPAGLGLRGRWLATRDLSGRPVPVFVLPLDHDGRRWRTDSWPVAAGKRLDLFNSEGPAGLRLPLNTLPPDALRRALTLEVNDGRLHVFFPPLLQDAFLELLGVVHACLRSARIGAHRLEGYLPRDELEAWRVLSITPDPGVLEVNLPPCRTVAEYAGWMTALDQSASRAGLRSFKQLSKDCQSGTGGGNHLLFGAPRLDDNPFFRHPGWITSILRYWQHHPSLSYLFTGDYVGPSSQAPRPDESGRDLYDIEMAYQFLEGLEPGGDRRHLISETLRHLHTDNSGNTHRSEISFDKFWNTAFDGGCRGLVEFRALETLPRPDWMSAVALLWQALAAHLFKNPFRKPLVNHGPRLHDLYFMPSAIWDDFRRVLRDLDRDGLRLGKEAYRDIWNWRFPLMFSFEKNGARLEIRKACESWPLLCETPIEGGDTSRFVDTSMERVEFTTNREFAGRYRVYLQGRELIPEKYPTGGFGAGLRYRRTALYPSLHPGIAPQMPLYLTVAGKRSSAAFRLDQDRRVFTFCAPDEAPPDTGTPCKKLSPNLVTCDLRIPG